MSFANLWILFLKVFQCVWTLAIFQSVCSNRSFVTLAWSMMPCSAIFSTRFLLLSRDSGSVHRPLPIYGASLGAYLTDTIAWSVGMADSLISQLKVKGSALQDMYTQSSLACICLLWVCALYVKARSIGLAQRHVSVETHYFMTSSGQQRRLEGEGN